MFYEKQSLKVKEFLTAVCELEKKFGLQIQHEDTQGGFEIEKLAEGETNTWLSRAADMTDLPRE